MGPDFILYSEDELVLTSKSKPIFFWKIQQIDSTY